MKRLLKPISALLFLSILSTSLVGCKKDELTEEEVAQMMHKTSFSIAVKEAYSEKGLTGASVTLVNGGKMVTQQTNESGIAHFADMETGEVSLTIAKEGYLSYTKAITINDGSRSNQINSKTYMYPVKGDASSSAIIKGTVTIQTDLTTPAPEIPTGLKVQAILVESDEDPFDQYGYNYFPYEGSSYEDVYRPIVYTSTVDSEGKFSFQIPVGLDGRSIRLKFPVVMYDQKLNVQSGSNVLESTKLVSFDPFVAATGVPRVGSNISAINPSGLFWPDGGLFQYYGTFEANYVERGEVIDLRVNYGTGTVRD